MPEASRIDFKFPVLGFTPDDGVWGFADRDTLTSCGPGSLKENMHAGLELIDAKGRRWIVHGVRRMGRARSWLRTLFDRLLSTPQSRIELEVESLDSVGLDDVKARIKSAMLARPSDWSELDGEGMDDPGLQDNLKIVARTKTIGSLVNNLGLDSFMAY